MKFFVRLCFCLIIASSVLGVSDGAQAQGLGEDWTTPANLSQSGAASQPRLVNLPDGELQAFWWDRFDGLMTSTNNPSDQSNQPWSDPTLSTINSEKLDSTPKIIADALGWVHAFWLESNEQGETPLMYSLLVPGSAGWSSPVKLSSSVISFDTATATTGEVSLAFIRNVHTSEVSAGVYVEQFNHNGPEWSSPFPIYSSIYYRLLTPEEAFVDLEYVVDEEGNAILYTIWEDTRQDKAYLAKSIDNGKSWGEAMALGSAADRPSHPVLAASPDQKVLVIWRSALQGGCALYQQETDIDTSVTVDTWSIPQPVLQDLTDCPQTGYFWGQGEHLYWLWGEGTSNLTIAGWDPTQKAWSEPRSFSFSFEDVESGQSISLGDLHSTANGETLAVVGGDEGNGEVWFTQAGIDVFDLVYAPPPPWSTLQRLTGDGEIPGYPAIAVDNTGRAHMAWSQTTSPDVPGTSLSYGSSYAGVVFSSELLSGRQDEFFRQPALVYEPGKDNLHLVWSGGENGSIYYSRASATEVGTMGAWLPPQQISPQAAASFPQIGLDAYGNLSVLYVVSLNEGRGVFLVNSQHEGQTWSEPIKVFDAIAEDWAMVDHPTLAISPAGELHTAWVEEPLPGFGEPMGIFYSYSMDSGKTWSKPLLVADNGNDWPHLVLAGDQIHILYAELVNSGGELHHRWTTVGQQSESQNWSLDNTIPNWRDISLPFGVSSDSLGKVHLVGMDSQQGYLRYTVWDSNPSSGNRWSAQEIQDGEELVKGGLGTNASANSPSGKLAVVCQAMPQTEEASLPALYYTSRQIEVSSIEALETSLPTPEPTLTLVPSPTSEPSQVPTLTPNLNVQPEPSKIPFPPIIFSGVVAGLILAGIFAALWWRSTRRR